jgi:hypothetical protein
MYRWLIFGRTDGGEICNPAAPAKTHTIMRLLRDWMLAHRRRVVVAVCAVAGVSLVAQGLRTV